MKRTESTSGWRNGTLLLAVLALAAFLRLWNLAGHEYGNIYYAAAVRSMAQSWHNSFYAAFDPGGFLAVDKPPVALWLQVLSVKLLGYSGWSLHLPQALLGIAMVGLVYHLTARVAGAAAGLLAALVLAVTPVCVAVDRSNLMDSCLLFTLLLAAWALLRATERGRWWPLLLCAVIVGVAFNVKMLAAYLVLPAFYLVYWLGAPLSRKMRTIRLAGATAVLALVSLSWPVAVDLTPTDQRPRVAASFDNSVLSLSLGLHGLGRIMHLVPGDRGGPGGGAGPPSGPPPALHAPPGPGGPGRPPGAPATGSSLAPLTGFSGTPGLFRLANREMAGHIAWFIPLAAVSLVAFVLHSPPRRPLSRRHLTVLLWVGWAGTCATLFSFSSGIIHTYYLNMLGPPIAALVGIGAVALWRLEDARLRATLLVAGILLTALGQAAIVTAYSAWDVWLVPLVVLGAVGALSAVVHGVCRGASRKLERAGAGLALAVLLVAPLAWAATPLLAPGSHMIPAADPVLLRETGYRLGGPPALPETEALIAYLQQRRDGERFLLATTDIHAAAPFVIATGEPVMAFGGFHGGEPITTAEEFAAAVAAGEVRYVLIGGRGPGPRGRNAVAGWVRRHGVRVPSRLWRGASLAGALSEAVPSTWGPVGELGRDLLAGPGGVLYDCCPVAAPR